MIDQEALKIFDEIYDKTYESVLKYVISNCSNIEDVKDIVQNVYVEVLKILKKDNTFNKEKSYIIGIAKNKVNEFYRFNYKAKIISLFTKREDFELVESIPNNIDIQKELIRKEDLNYIWSYLKKKKLVIAKVFYLYYYTDMKIKDIARELNISESNVKHYLYRTLDDLKEYMKDRSGDGDENV